MRGGKSERGIGDGREGFSIEYFRRDSFGQVGLGFGVRKGRC